MELDKRILPGKYILTCFDAKEAEKFVGQMGYAADDISKFADLDSTELGKLKRAPSENGKGGYPYTVVTEYTCDQFAFFLPAAWCKAQKNKNSLRMTV